MSSRTCPWLANTIVGAMGMCRPLMHPLVSLLSSLRGTRAPPQGGVQVNGCPPRSRLPPRAGHPSHLSLVVPPLPVG